MNEKLPYMAIVEARRRLTAGEYKDRYATLGEAKLDGNWVSPPQKTSYSSTGPVLVAHNFLDFERAIEHQPRILNAGGYLPDAPFNKILNCALRCADIERTDIYITQVLHFLPRKKAPRIAPPSLVLRSFCEVTRHEIFDRRVIALGSLAKDMCRFWVDKYSGFNLIKCLTHPSAPGDPCAKAKELANALKEASGP